jgi:DNA helicase-2/ATP-dependent DNA helicase PcrA
MCANRLIVAAAGSGKTSLIVDETTQHTQGNVLITTFTLANEQSIRKKFIKKVGCIPQHVTIQTWFAFLLEHGVRPYRYWNQRVNGMLLVSTASGLRYTNKNGTPVYWGEDENFGKHYFTDSMDVYSDKIAKLVFRCNMNSNGKVIKRLEGIYSWIYIDEVQDMAGWDLEILKLLLKSGIIITMVGDPRQTVYHTHDERKYKKYSDGKIRDFIQSECKRHCDIDEEKMKDSYRNSAAICVVSSRLYPEYRECESLLKKANNHMGLFFVRKQDVREYSRTIVPLQLRLKRDKNNMPILSTKIMNFGESKGIESDHVLIYPTKDMLKWLQGDPVTLKFKTRAQLYVALTRAFFSVGIIVNDNFDKQTEEISLWITRKDEELEIRE